MTENKKQESFFIFSVVFVALCFVQAAVGWLMPPFWFAVISFAVVTYLFFKPEVAEVLPP